MFYINLHQVNLEPGGRCQIQQLRLARTQEMRASPPVAPASTQTQDLWDAVGTHP